MKPVGFDNTMLSLLLNPHCGLPTDANGKPVELAKRRAEFLVERLGKSRQKIVIPTPAAAEVLTAIGPDAQSYFEIIVRQRLFEIAAFDQKCALELAFLNRDVFAAGDKRDSLEPYQKIKIDRQIIAIFVASGVENVYTDDTSLANRCKLCGLNPIRTSELPVPENDRQIRMEFEPHEEIPETPSEPDGEGANGTLNDPPPENNVS